MVDLLQRIADQAPVVDGLARARSAVDKMLAHRFLRTDAGAATVEVGERAARLSAVLDGEGDLLPQALTLHAEMASLSVTWAAAPRQALARMHVLASDAGAADVGRPLVATPRLETLFVALEDTSAPAVVVAGVVHAEVLALRVFGSRDGLVARTAARAALVSSGYDPRVLIAFEAGWTAESYQVALEAYAAGDAIGWMVGWCDAVIAGAELSRSVCDELRAARG